MPIDVSVVIVNFNTRDQTSDCVESVLRESGDLSVQVIVVDNGSRDDSVEALRGRFPGVVLVDAGENLGFARGVNRGAVRAEGEYLLLLNPDTVVLPGSLPAMLRFARIHQAYDMFGGRTLRPDGSVEPSSCWGAPSLWSLLMFATMMSTLFKRSRIFDPESLGDWDRGTVREVPIITGCLLLLRRTLFTELGGMDEDFFLYGEDAEFSLRARARGFHCVVVPEAVIIHEVGGSSDATGGGKGCMVQAGKVTLLRKAWSPVKAALGIRLLLTGVALRAALERLTGRQGAWTVVWRRRADWFDGYPRAKETIFGLKEPVEG